MDVGGGFLTACCHMVSGSRIFMKIIMIGWMATCQI